MKPIPGDIISPFGITRNKVGQKQPDFHRGVDQRGQLGEPIQAPNHGVVLLATHYKFHGKTILLNHGQGVGSIYIHLDSIAVQEGDAIYKGDVLGTVGSTGLATASHLHWGIYVLGEAVDPLQWLEVDF